MNNPQDMMDVDTESELSSLHTTPESSPSSSSSKMDLQEPSDKSNFSVSVSGVFILDSQPPQTPNLLAKANSLTLRVLFAGRLDAFKKIVGMRRSGRRTQTPGAKVTKPVLATRKYAVSYRSRAKKGKSAVTGSKIAKQSTARSRKGRSAAAAQLTPPSSSRASQENNAAASGEVPHEDVSDALDAVFNEAMVDTPMQDASIMAPTSSLASPMTPTRQSVASAQDMSSQQTSSGQNSESPELPKFKGKGPVKRVLADTDFIDSDAESDEDEASDAASDVADAMPSPPSKKRVKTVETTPAAPYYHSEAQKLLPAPFGEPPVWASTRQALCQTLPYYRAYQSGPYTSSTHGKSKVFGLLIDKEGSEHHEVFNEEVVITRVGGGKEYVDGRLTQVTEKVRSSAHLAFERSRDEHSPVAIIAGGGKKTSPSRMPHYYNVLAWFHVTDVWVEIEGNLKVPMVRLEKIKLEEKSWWAAAGTSLPDPHRVLRDETVETVCNRCHKPSRQIFETQWTCLHPECGNHFQGFYIPAGMEPGEFYGKLDYHPHFLDKRTQCQGGPVPDLVPEPSYSIQMGPGLSGYESQFGKGVVCPQCHACCRRSHWTQFSCEQPTCDWVHEAETTVASVAQAIGDGHIFREKQDPAILSRQFFLRGYVVTEFLLPGESQEDGSPGEVVGIIRHFQATPAIHQELQGPNLIFRKLQEGKLKLSRKPCKNPNKVSEMMTNHYYLNFGAPYKFVAPVDSLPFSDAPDVILNSLMRMRWAGQETVSQPGEFVPFNELMAVGYFEDGAMGYHDDGESTLGPTVSSLSLGCSSTMSFRPKKRTNIGGVSGNQKGTKPAMLSITLKHGDMMVMHGAHIQRLYEHEVVPHGKLRFVLTCRHIVPAQIDNDADRAKAISDGALPANIAQYEYNGGLDAQLQPLLDRFTKESLMNYIEQMGN